MQSPHGGEKSYAEHHGEGTAGMVMLSPHMLPMSFGNQKFKQSTYASRQKKSKPGEAPEPLPPKRSTGIPSRSTPRSAPKSARRTQKEGESRELASKPTPTATPPAMSEAATTATAERNNDDTPTPARALPPPPPFSALLDRASSFEQSPPREVGAAESKPSPTPSSPGMRLPLQPLLRRSSFDEGLRAPSATSNSPARPLGSSGSGTENVFFTLASPNQENSTSCHPECHTSLAPLLTDHLIAGLARLESSTTSPAAEEDEVIVDGRATAPAASDDELEDGEGALTPCAAPVSESDERDEEARVLSLYSYRYKQAQEESAREESALAYDSDDGALDDAEDTDEELGAEAEADADGMASNAPCAGSDGEPHAHARETWREESCSIDEYEARRANLREHADSIANPPAPTPDRSMAMLLERAVNDAFASPTGATLAASVDIGSPETPQWLRAAELTLANTPIPSRRTTVASLASSGGSRAGPATDGGRAERRASGGAPSAHLTLSSPPASSILPQSDAQSNAAPAEEPPRLATFGTVRTVVLAMVLASVATLGAVRLLASPIAVPVQPAAEEMESRGMAATVPLSATATPESWQLATAIEGLISGDLHPDEWHEVCTRTRERPVDAPTTREHPAMMIAAPTMATQVIGASVEPPVAWLVGAEPHAFVMPLSRRSWSEHNRLASWLALPIPPVMEKPVAEPLLMLLPPPKHASPSESRVANEKGAPTPPVPTAGVETQGSAAEAEATPSRSSVARPMSRARWVMSLVLAFALLKTLVTPRRRKFATWLSGALATLAKALDADRVPASDTDGLAADGDEPTSPLNRIRRYARQGRQVAFSHASAALAGLSGSADGLGSEAAYLIREDSSGESGRLVITPVRRSKRTGGAASGGARSSGKQRSGGRVRIESSPGMRVEAR